MGKTESCSGGDPRTLPGTSDSVSCGVTAPFPGSWCAHAGLCALQESVSPARGGSEVSKRWHLVHCGSVVQAVAYC